MSFLIRKILAGSIVALLFCLDLKAQISINEILAENKTATNYNGADWIELFNRGPAAIDLGEYSLTDSLATPRKWVFPSGVSIGANSYLVVLLDSSKAPSVSAADSPPNTGFSIKGTGDQVALYSPTSQLIDSVRFGPQAADYSIGRIPNGTGAFVLNYPTPNLPNTVQQLGSDAALLINEWMASPSNGKDWFEVYNPGPLPVQLSGLFFTDDNNVPSPVAPLSYIGTGLNGFIRFYANNSTNDNEVNFKLGGSGDVIALYRSGSQINRVQFGPQIADVSQGRLPDGSLNIRSLNNATPGESNLIIYEGLIVNELLSHTDPPLEDAVEFRNVTVASIDISGWYLSNSRDDLKKYRIPAGSVVPPGGFIVFYEYQFNGPNAQTPFTFNSAHGDQVYLAQANSNGELTGSIVQEFFEPAENGVSFGHYLTSVPGDYKFVAMDRITFGRNKPATVEEFRIGSGQINSAPKVGPIVINELMVKPLSTSPDGADNTADEYIELLNITGATVPLYDPANPENHWRLQSAVGYTFPAGAAIPPFAYALIVPFDPVAAPSQLSAFRAKYSVPGVVQVFGPYAGKLQNGGDAVELYKPDPPQIPPHPDAGFVPYIRVDKVNYSLTAPWPTGAAGTGKSLQRKSALLFGNDPANWEAAAPTAGAGNPSQPFDSDGDGMPDLWEVYYGLNPQDPSDSTGDLDGDGATNLSEYQNGTDPRAVQTAPRISNIVINGSAGVSIAFTSTPGQTYTLQGRTSLSEGAPWLHLANKTATGTTTILGDVPQGDQQRFYRVVTPALQ